MSTTLSNPQGASGYHDLLIAKGLTNIKHFDGLFTQIAISENGYLAIYYPYEPAIKNINKTGLLSLKFDTFPEQKEKLEIFHISQIIDFDIDVEGDEKTSVSSGFGGALIGGLLGGATGAIIGSAATSGSIDTTTTITGVNLILQTKDFNNPRIEVRLFNPFRVHNAWSGGTGRATLPWGLRQYCIDKTHAMLSKEGKALAKNVFNDGEVNIAQIEALQSTLTQLLTAQQQSEQAESATPQISRADELAKFKLLLDSGVISQEEFDIKKKQLLGL